MRGQPAPPDAIKKKPNTVSAAIEDNLFQFMEDYRWANRMSKTEVVVSALTAWAKTKGFDPNNPDAPVTIEPETPDSGETVGFS